MLQPEFNLAVEDFRNPEYPYISLDVTTARFLGINVDSIRHAPNSTTDVLTRMASAGRLFQAVGMLGSGVEPQDVRDIFCSDPEVDTYEVASERSSSRRGLCAVTIGQKICAVGKAIESFVNGPVRTTEARSGLYAHLNYGRHVDLQQGAAISRALKCGGNTMSFVSVQFTSVDSHGFDEVPTICAGNPSNTYHIAIDPGIRVNFGEDTLSAQVDSSLMVVEQPFLPHMTVSQRQQGIANTLDQASRTLVIAGLGSQV